MKTIAKSICVIIMLVLVDILCSSFPDLFTYDMFILCFLMNMTIDKIWGDE